MASGAEIAAILRLSRTCEAEGVPAVLARLVSVESSHYRPAGARMLIAADGRSEGAISAGCLEADLRRRSGEVLSSGRTESIEYDSRSFEDLAWGLGTGCNGVVRVLAEGEEIPSGREGEYFVEEIAPPISLLIAGAGPDADPLARIAAGLGWTVTILSSRAPQGLRARFSDLSVRFADIDAVKTIPLHGRSAAVVMSHRFADDALALEQLLARRLRYLGVLGPRERTERLLLSFGAPAGAARAIRSPVGLDVGAETAEEIALSIVAEIQEVLSKDERTSRLGTA